VRGTRQCKGGFVDDVGDEMQLTKFGRMATFLGVTKPAMSLLLMEIWSPGQQRRGDRAGTSADGQPPRAAQDAFKLRASIHARRHATSALADEVLHTRRSGSPELRQAERCDGRCSVRPT